MTETATLPRPVRQSDALLAERERKGVRTLTFVRAVALAIIAVSHWVVGASVFEKVAATALAAIAAVAIVVSVVLLARKRHVGAVGVAGSLIDIAILAALPVIWYVSVGGQAVPPAYMLKTQLSIMSLTLVALNALALRPLYPILVAAGAVAVHGALMAYILADERTVVGGYLDAIMGPALSAEFTLTAMMTIGLVGLITGYMAYTARRTVVQGVQLEVSNARLGRYFSPGVVARIADEGGGVTGLGGRTQDVAVMFLDIRGFTAMTEKLAPSDAVALLSQYHERMVQEIFRFGGTIDKFIGDAIMVTFGTPDPANDDAERAVRAGLAMNRALADLNADRSAAGQPAIRHGIGIHYGPVIAGNIGTESRLEYTVIGDTVNVASRVEDACKATGETFLISDAVQARIPADIAVRALAEHQVKGRQAPVRLFAVDG